MHYNFEINEIPQNTTKENQCKYCNKILSRYDSLNRHMKTYQIIGIIF